jgi:hypothetical protein
MHYLQCLPYGQLVLGHVSIYSLRHMGGATPIKGVGDASNW